jgi:dethiobiotin synthetase
VTGADPVPVVLVVGTGTEVGKTWVSARLLERLRAGGLQVAARKPAQSHDDRDPADGFDAAVLAAATGERPDDVCRPERTYAVPMAPPMAADVLGRAPFTVADLAAEVGWERSDADRPDIGLVETAGGARSPQAEDGDAVDFGRLLRPRVVVLVADAGLGTIHAVRATVAAFAAGDLPLVVVLNRFDPASELHRRNRAWLVERDGLTLVVTPGGEDELAALVRETCGC